jgi:hypothetical protein
MDKKCTFHHNLGVASGILEITKGLVLHGLLMDNDTLQAWHVQ